MALSDCRPKGRRYTRRNSDVNSLVLKTKEEIAERYLEGGATQTVGLKPGTTWGKETR